MSDLISRSALSKQLKQYKSEWKLAEPFHEGIASGLKIAIEVTDRQPTVEAKEVVHGEWIKTRLAMEYQCSNCQNVVYAESTRTGHKLFNFCPNCGADMRKKVE